MGFSQGFVDTRLDTWKSIAQYLVRSSRTVQRWHAEYGLPVHHLGGDASSVYAYKDELDLWLRNRNSPDAGGHGRTNQGKVKVTAELVKVEEHHSRQMEGDQEPVLAPRREVEELIASAQTLWESISASNLSTIARMYRRATDLDPSNAVAHASLSQALIAQAVLGNLHPSAAFHAAEAALERAFEIDPRLFEGLCASSMLKIFLYRDWEAGRESLDEAFRLCPTASQALVGRAFLAIAENTHEEASEILRRAAVERPLNTSVAELLCWVEYLAGRFETAVSLIADARDTGHSGAILDATEALCGVLLGGAGAQLRIIEEMTSSSPRNYTLQGVLGYAYGKTGQMTAARRVLESMTRMGLTGVYDFAYPIALTFLGLGEQREAATWLEQSYKHGSLWSLGFGSDPILAELRKDMWFREFCGPANYPARRLRMNPTDSASLVRTTVPCSA